MAPPPIFDFEARVADALRRSGFSRTGATLVAACSGGPDSTALLRCLDRLRETYGLSLLVAHLNHDFRGAEADDDAAFVERLADSLGLACSVVKQDPIAYQRERGISSFEQGAREMRYSFLAGAAQSVGASAVATGHTSDDLAETVLLHLLRGAGLHGLRGMTELAPWPWLGQGRRISLFRPLLGSTKDEVKAYCREIGQDFREDTGNYLWRFTRNRVRHQLMPRLAEEFNPRVREALTRLARTAAEEVDFLEEELDRVWPETAAEDGDGVTLSASILNGLHPALQRLAFRRAYVLVTGDARRLGESHLAAMLKLAGSDAGGRELDLPGGVKLRRSYGELRVSRAHVPTAPFPELPGEHPISFSVGVGESREFEAGPWRVTIEARKGDNRLDAIVGGPGDYAVLLDREALGDWGTIRAWRSGDRIQPLGMLGSKKLQDLFTDAKVPRYWRDRVPLLVCDRGVAWVAGYRTAEWAKAGGEGRPVLWIRLER